MADKQHPIMNGRSGIIISLGLNLTLLAVTGSLLLWRPSVEAPCSNTAHSNQTQTRVVAAPKTSEPPAVAVTEVNGPFSWNEVASADFKVYAANLRGVGCPERTVRDIIESEVSELFRRRVRELVDPVQNRFWDLVRDKEALEKTVNEKYEGLQALAEEREALLQKVFGEQVDSGRSEKERTARELRLKEYWDFLPPDRLQQALALQEKYEELQDSIPALLGDEDRNERRKQFEAQHMAELAALLSPDEMTEYRLRHSNYANARFSLLRIEVTEAEARELAVLRQKFPDEKSGKQEQNERFRAQFDEAARELLGEERFAEYERVQNPHYPELAQITERLGLGARAAADALEIRQAAEEAAKVVRSGLSLDGPQKAEALRQIRAETQQAMAQLMGTNYAIYRKKFGGWMRLLGALE